MNIISSVFFAWCSIVFCISGLFINFLQLLVLPLYWIKRSWYHTIIPVLSYGIFSQITVLGEWWATIDFKLYVENTEDLKYVGKESSVIICNHYSDIDWLTAWIFAERNGFVGKAKVVSKDTIKYLPVVGWCWWFAEFGFLKRNWQQDKDNFYKLIESMRNNTNHFWMGLLCEGTRRTDEKLKASQQFALNNNIVPLKHHLFPRTKGFSLIVEGLHDTVPAIYDFEFGFPKPETATLMNLFNRGQTEVLMHFRRIPMCNLPKTYDELSNYIIEHYRGKDVLYETFLRTGKFPGTLAPLPRKINNLVVFITVNLLAGVVSVAWLSYCIDVFGSAVVGLSALLICFSVYGLMLFITLYSKSDRGSKFGLKKSS